MPSPGTFRLVTAPSPGRSAAIAVLHLSGDVSKLTAALMLGDLGVGSVRLRDFGGIDTGVVVCPDAHTLLLMPHAGQAVLRALLGWLAEHGLQESGSFTAQQTYPEAASDLEAEMLAMLARAASPLAVDLLLDQPRRWADLGVPSIKEAAALPAALRAEIQHRSSILNRLVTPPTVVALGPPNVGKSTLLNSLAGRAVSIVADLPGTTRDHVGVRLNLAGLVVTYIDTPGINTSLDGHHAHSDPAIQHEAQQLALDAARSADLILSCGDCASGFLRLASTFASVPSISVCLRADLGIATHTHDLTVSATTGAGIEQLTAAIKAKLLPGDVLNHPGPWNLWPHSMPRCLLP